MTLALSKKTWLGVARESTSGTAITTPTFYVPTKSNLKAMRKNEILNEERGDVNEEYDIVPTIRWADWDAKGPFYPDAHVYFLLGALGGISSAQPNATAAPTVYKHTLSLADVPPSLTLHKSEHAQFYYSPYGVTEKFSIKFDAAGGKLVEFDTSGKAIWPVINGAPPTPSFTTVQPFSGTLPTLNLFGSSTTDIIDLQVDYERKYTLWNPADGSQDWVTAYPGARKVGLSFTARFDSDTLYQRYKNAGYDTFTFDVLGAQLANLWVVTLGAPSAGTFTLTIGGQTTSAIAYNASAATVQAAVVLLSSVGAGGCTVTGSAGGPYTLNFTTAVPSTSVLTGSGAGLTGGSFTIGAQTLYNYELNIGAPVIFYESMEHDHGKDNVLIKAKARILATQQTINGVVKNGTGNNLINMYVQNTVANYTV